MAMIPTIPAVMMPPELTIVGPWQISVSPGVVTTGDSCIEIADSVTLTVGPSEIIRIKDESYDQLPLFDDTMRGFWNGVRLEGLITAETTAPDMLVPESLVVKTGPGDSPHFQNGVDYGGDSQWGTLWLLPDGTIGPETPVWVDYECGRARLDTLAISQDGALSILRGVPDNAIPIPPTPGPDAVALAHIWVPGRLTSLTDENLYPIVESHYPEPVPAEPLPAARLLPRTWAKLQSGQPLHILAWGDSVTDGGEASDEMHRYQDRFVALLKQRFPQATLQLTTVAWSAHTSADFLNAPPGSNYHFEEKVIQSHPDLILMEFVNDSTLPLSQVEKSYTHLLQRFQTIGAEWILMTPHYLWPPWMGTNMTRIGPDPRPYTAFLRQFASTHPVALADAALRWGHLLQEGIPYMTLLKNSFNHPDDRGHEIFAKALMELFGGSGVESTDLQKEKACCI